MTDEQIFAAALPLEHPSERTAYLERACAGDAAQRARIVELLKAYDDAGSFLNKPVAQIPPLPFPGKVDHQAATQSDSISGSPTMALDFLTPSDLPNRLGKLGSYEVQEVIGRGGMGVVLRAVDPKLNRVVAIKVLAPELAAIPMAGKRFLREARAAAAVSHDHVVTIHAVDDVSPIPFMVMECIIGQSLQQKIDRQGALGIREILRIGMQIAAGLAAAHKQGLVHRDIKPANILLENGIERVKITDFGLARAVDDVSFTQAGQVTGTPQYMSPEQAMGEHVDHRSDLFSLGSVLYTMCTGRPAFRATSTVAMLRRVVDDTPRPISEINAEIPDWLTAIIDRLMAKKPDDRLQTATEVAEHLEKWLAHCQQPQSVARPEMTPEMSSASLTPTQRAILSWTETILAACFYVIMGVLVATWLGWLPTGTGTQANNYLLLFMVGVIMAAAAMGWMFEKHNTKDVVRPAIPPPPRPARTGLATPVWMSLALIGCMVALFPLNGMGILRTTDMKGASDLVLTLSLFTVVGIALWSVAQRLRRGAWRETVLGVRPGLSVVSLVFMFLLNNVLFTAWQPSPWRGLVGFERRAQLHVTFENPKTSIRVTRPGQPSSTFVYETMNGSKQADLTLLPGQYVITPIGEGFEQHASIQLIVKAGESQAIHIATPVNAEANQRTNLEGRWNIVREENSGIQLPSHLRSLWWDLRGRQRREQPAQGAGVTECEFQINNSPQPRHFDLLSNGKILRHGIYQLKRQSKGEELTVCVSTPPEPRPKTFVTRPNTSLYLTVLQRDPTHQVTPSSPTSAAPVIDPSLPAAVAPFDAQQARKHQAAWSAHLGAPLEYTNRLGMKFCLIPPGEFTQGSNPEAADRLTVNPDWYFTRWVGERRRAEGPPRVVRISRPMYVGAHEVTVGQFAEFLKETGSKTEVETDTSGGYGWREGAWRRDATANWHNPGFMQTHDHPVSNIGWKDAVAFCEWLSRKEGMPYRLPREAEWEYACRAGSTTLFSTGDDPASLEGFANIADAASLALHNQMTWAASWNDGFAFTAPVGSFKPNNFGLFDMHGNVHEWCSDFYDAQAYAKSPATDPTGPVDGDRHVYRGGGWDNWLGFCRSADRYGSHSDSLRTQWAGFRVVLDEVPPNSKPAAELEEPASPNPRRATK